MKKMTYAVAIDKALAGEVSEEVIERLTELKETLAKRSEKRSEKRTEAQDETKAVIANAMAAIGKPAQVGEIVAIAGFSSQKVTSMLTKMVADGTAVRTVDKKKAFYALSGEGAVDGE